MRSTTRTKQLLARVNHVFIYIDVVLASLCLLGFFISIPKPCAMEAFTMYCIFFAVQALQHVLVHRFPRIDINKHHMAFRRVITSICLLDMAYLMMAVTFWEKNPSHPIYCLLCVELGLSAWIGLLLILHEVFVIGWAVTLI